MERHIYSSPPNAGFLGNVYFLDFGGEFIDISFQFLTFFVQIDIVWFAHHFLDCSA